MKITCHSCTAKYTVSDDKVQGKTVKIKCRKCGATILVGPGGVTGGAQDANGSSLDAHSVSAGDVAASGEGMSFMVNVAEGDQRTMTLDEIVEAYNTEVINAETYVWQEGMDDWQTLGENEAIVAALHAAPDVAMASGDAYSAPQAAYQAPVAAAPAPMPVAASPRPFPSPEPAARPAARREPARRSQDLFGGGLEMQSSAAADPGGNTTGQRDENSVLFSLSALTSSASTTTGPKTTATREDSGLIDLKALAANAAPGAPAPQNLVPDTAAVFPLGAPPIAMAQPVASTAYAIPESPPSRSKLPIVLGVGVAVAAMVGVFYVVQGGGQEETKPPAPTTVVVVAPPPPVAAEVPTQTTAAAPASAAPSASAVAAGKWPPPGYKPPPGGVGKPPPPGGGGAKPPPPPPPAGGGNSCTAKCGGDLMCAMKCSTK